MLSRAGNAFLYAVKDTVVSAAANRDFLSRFLSNLLCSKYFQKSAKKQDNSTLYEQVLRATLYHVLASIGSLKGINRALPA